MRCLFLGGQNDGRRIEIDIRRPYIELPLKVVFPDVLLSSGELSDMEIVVRTEIFRRLEFSAGEQVFFLYVHKDVRDADAIRRLIDNYWCRKED